MAINYLSKDGLTYLWGKIKTYIQGEVDDSIQYIPYGKLDATSTSTLMTATVPGVTELKDGTSVMIKNGVVTSASGVTLNVNGLGAKPIYSSMAASSPITTIFNINYTMLFTFDATRISGGCWMIYYGYNANTTYTNASLGQGYATCTTAEATTAKTASLSSYSLTTGGYVGVKFTNAVPASATLSVNSKTAKAIYYKGAAITAGIIKAGDLAVFLYNGSQYHLVAIDRNVDIEIPTKVSDLTNDAGYISSYTETDPTVPAWAKESSKPSYTAAEVGAVPTSRTVNGHALSADISLTASDVGALPSSTSIPTLSDSTTSTSSTVAASSKAVKTVNDRITYGSTDLTAGTSSLETGVYYAYYE